MAFQINRPNTNARLNTLNMINDEPLSSKIMTYLGKGMAAALVLSTINGQIPSVNAADYAPAAPPPTLAPQVARQSPRAAQPGVPEKWVYSKFLDQVEKDQVERVTFSPDGKKAVGVDNDGDRFTVDIPNDPNLLSFLVQHKVEINVAPINANGGTDGAAANLQYQKVILINYYKHL